MPNIWRRLRGQLFYQVCALMGIAFLLVFAYTPMVGLIIAFKNFKLTSGIPGFITSEWVGFKWFIEFYNDINFWQIIRNTVAISLLKLFFTFPIPILFALVLNEVRKHSVKRTVQTVSYLPHFISWIVVSGMIFSFFNEQTGVVNHFLVSTGLADKPISFLSDPAYFWPMAVLSDIWKEMGWWTIIFLAAIVGVDPALYEAAVVDGASRMQRIWYITLPTIKGTIIIVLILSIGNLFGGGLGGSNFEQSYLLGNPVNNGVSEILQTYTLKMGLAQGRYSYATAIGLIQSVISLLLIYLSNYLSKRFSGVGLF
ncbi:ABC transporter permease [Paenibacillus mendelii]|uniref:ABC transporter permease n=1 Tax=Paenibacillus mendelii TaxID=206163 RepID=A0ABV6JFQ8_9BACL|nr:ABC transporter permease subunit [Paenibacillus mendelii]MCQ6557604.1 ABC transporter permease subunit [Paenibacillus mendelii]